MPLLSHKFNLILDSHNTGCMLKMNRKIQSAVAEESIQTSLI